MKHRILLSLLLLLTSFSLLSCNQSKADAKESKKEVAIDTLVNAMTKEAGKLPAMDTFSSTDEDASDTFSFLCDLAYDKVKAFTITYSSEATADEIFIVQVKEQEDVEAAKTSLRNRKETRRAAFANYLPSEVDKIDDAMIVNKGNYIALVICKYPQATSDKFLSFFE